VSNLILKKVDISKIAYALLNNDEFTGPITELNVIVFELM
jgi:hypothetical protein